MKINIIISVTAFYNNNYSISIQDCHKKFIVHDFWLPVKAVLLFELYSIACLLAVIWMSLCQLRQGNSLVNQLMSQVMQQTRGSTETLSAFAVWNYRVLISSMLPWQKLETFKIRDFHIYFRLNA